MILLVYRLVKLFGLGIINENAIRDELNQVKADRNTETKHLALDALYVKVYATGDSMIIQDIIPVDLVTAEQTLASLLTGA